MSDLNQFDIVTATFRPKRTDNLKPGCEKYIGKTTAWQAYWLIEDGDYQGQWAMVVSNLDWPFAWVPECDLEVISEQ